MLKLRWNQRVTFWCYSALGYAALLGCQSSTPRTVPGGMDEEGLAAMQGAVQERLANSEVPREMEQLAFLEGQWELVLEGASSPGDSAPTVARGHAKVSRVLGNRFLEWDASLAIGGQDLHSRGLLGFDQAFSRYEFLWVSELSGAQRLARGRGNPQREGLTLEFVDNDARSGAKGRFQTLLLVSDVDHFLLEQRGYDPEQDRWLATLRTRYSRSAASATE